MKIEHLAIWVRDLEISRNFYEAYFEASSGTRYYNAKKHFQVSHFTNGNNIKKDNVCLTLTIYGQILCFDHLLTASPRKIRCNGTCICSS